MLRHFEVSMPESRKSTSGQRDVVQVKNPRTDRYVKIDRSAGKIIAHKKSEGPYKDIPVARKK
ncbi:MAG: hypothetical protein WEA08_01735 [Woeseia sp.]